MLSISPQKSNPEKLLDNPASQTYLSLIRYKHLPRSQRPLLLLKGDLHLPLSDLLQPTSGGRILTITNFPTQSFPIPLLLSFIPYPMPILSDQRTRFQRFALLVGDIQQILLNIDAIHVRLEIQSQSVFLPDGIQVRSLMRPDFFPFLPVGTKRIHIENVPLLLLKSLQQKLPNRHIPDKAESLTVFSLSIGKSELFRQCSDFSLFQRS